MFYNTYEVFLANTQNQNKRTNTQPSRRVYALTRETPSLQVFRAETMVGGLPHVCRYCGFGVPGFVLDSVVVVSGSCFACFEIFVLFRNPLVWCLFPVCLKSSDFMLNSVVMVSVSRVLFCNPRFPPVASGVVELPDRCYCIAQ